MNLNEFYEEKSGICLLWMGNDGWVINFYGSSISTDLDLHSPIRKPLPSNVDLKEMANHITASFVTHEHSDHFNPDTCLLLQKYSGCRFIIPKSCYYQAVRMGLDEQRIIIAVPRINFILQDIEVCPIRAIHGHYLGSVYQGANMNDCGYVLRKKGFTLYQPGDTILLDEHFTMKNIDLLFFSPTEHNMFIDNSVRFIQMIKPRYIFPQHYDSYVSTPENAFWTKGFTEEVFEKLTDIEKKNFFKIPQGRPVMII
jgi:L-ascorbate metabolism protein UlaG (beta-lactamase superfamily)